MNRKPIFEGAASALVTPMNANGVDYPKFKELIEWQIEEGIDALVIAGTSGEGSTLTDEEHREVLKFAVEVVDGRVPVIAGAGSNDSAHGLELVDNICPVCVVPLYVLARVDCPHELNLVGLCNIYIFCKWFIS